MGFRSCGIFAFLVLVGIVSCQFNSPYQDGPRPGSYGDYHQADPFGQAAADSMRSQVEAQVNVPKLDSYQVLQYSTQVVAGTNWDFQILAGYGGKQIKLHVEAFQPMISQQLTLRKLEQLA